MDKIYLKGMEFYAYHGVFPEEAKLGQRFVVDVEIETNLRHAGQTDELQYTLNYADIYEVVKRTAQLERYKLLEAVAETTAGRLLQQFPTIQKVSVKVTKNTPPIEGVMAGAAVEVFRERSEFY